MYKIKICIKSTSGCCSSRLCRRLRVWGIPVWPWESSQKHNRDGNRNRRLSARLSFCQFVILPVCQLVSLSVCQ